MEENVEEFILIGVFLAIVIAVLMFLIFESSFSSALGVGPNNNDLCENQFSHALSGYPNRQEGTPLFRGYLTDCCYNAATAYNTCKQNWCALLNCNDGTCNTNFVNCVNYPNSTILHDCSNISSSNTAALESCIDSTIVANNATQIQNCDTSNPTCIAGDNQQYCTSCALS